MPIKYVVGDATEPIGDNLRVILHVVNNKGGWGRGFVLALSKKWKTPEQVYKSDASGFRNLGNIQAMHVEDGIAVVNMVAQDGYVGPGWPRAINYAALGQCLMEVKKTFLYRNVSFHMPRIGAGLGGGDWAIIEQIIQDALGTEHVFVYDLPTPPGFEEPPVGRRVYSKEWSFEHVNEDGWRGAGVSRMSWEELWAGFGPVWLVDEVVNPPFSRVFREGGTPKNEAQAEQALDEMGF